MKEFFVKVSTNEELSLKVDIVEKNIMDISSNLSFFYNSINCERIDIVSLTDKIDAVVDDEGLLVSDNPVFDINGVHQIAGEFLIGKVKVSEDATETVGFSSLEEVNQKLKDINVSVIGITN